MSAEPNRVHIDTASVDGLSDLFRTANSPPRAVHARTVTPGWTLTEAADHFGVTSRTIRRWIKERRVDARKIDGPRGPEWRIWSSSVDTEDDTTGSTMAPSLDQNRLLDMIQDLQNKLAGASYRNGYLESQLQERDDTIKLLTDQRSRKSWWARFCSLFTAGQP